MKLYIWKHKKTAMSPQNFYPASKAVAVGKNGMYVEAVHAFFKKKDAKKYLDEIGWDKEIQDLYEIVTVSL